MAWSFKKLFDVLIGSQVLRGCLFGASGNSATAFTRDPRVPNLWWVNVGANDSIARGLQLNNISGQLPSIRIPHLLNTST
jgi:hypothetical protein